MGPRQVLHVACCLLIGCQVDSRKVDSDAIYGHFNVDEGSVGAALQNGPSLVNRYLRLMGDDALFVEYRGQRAPFPPELGQSELETVSYQARLPAAYLAGEVVSVILERGKSEQPLVSQVTLPPEPGPLSLEPPPPVRAGHAVTVRWTTPIPESRLHFHASGCVDPSLDSDLPEGATSFTVPASALRNARPGCGLDVGVEATRFGKVDRRYEGGEIWAIVRSYASFARPSP